jgi:hypothetical protein
MHSAAKAEGAWKGFESGIFGLIPIALALLPVTAVADVALDAPDPIDCHAGAGRAHMRDASSFSKSCNSKQLQGWRAKEKRHEIPPLDFFKGIAEPRPSEPDPPGTEDANAVLTGTTPMFPLIPTAVASVRPSTACLEAAAVLHSLVKYGTLNLHIQTGLHARRSSAHAYY